MALKVALRPAPDRVQLAAKGGRGAKTTQDRVEAALIDMGAEIVEPQDADALMWLDVAGSGDLAGILDEAPNIKWVQLPWAGVESFASSGLFERDLKFTCNKGALGEQVGEHALFLILGCYRHVTAQARNKSWTVIEPVSLFRKRVTILGAGGIATTLIDLLEPFDCYVTVVRRNATLVSTADQTLTNDQLDGVLPNTDVLVVAVPLTPETTGMIGAKQLGLLPSCAIVVNVARGAHIDTDALVEALKDNDIAAAGLDVTDPEPLPAEHALWQMDNVLITSHCADSVEFVTDKLIDRIRENYRRFEGGDELLGQVDPKAGF